MMKQKWIAILLVLMVALSLAACGEEEETTLTGMVVSVDGTVISLVEMDADSMGGINFGKGERPEMPEGMEGMEGFQDFGGFNPGNFGDFNPEDFEIPDGSNFPQFGNGERPERPEGMEDMTMPEGITMPEGMTIPENGQMPDFFGGNGMSGFGEFSYDGETKQVDIANAHISVEIDGGKASGSMEDIKTGVFVTITMNGKGEVTNVLVSSDSSRRGLGNAI